MTDEARKKNDILESVPKVSDPFVQKYLNGRNGLVAQEKKQRSDRLFRANLTPAAAEAACIVAHIRAEEQQSLWNDSSEESYSETSNRHYVFPGMQFTLAKEKIEESRLWTIVRRMPKGALLHCHLEAMVDIRHSLNDAFDLPEICLKSDRPLSTLEARGAANILFGYSANSLDTQQSIWDSSYAPGTLVSLCTAAETYPERGQAGFVDWVRSKCTITFDESLKQHQGPNEIWRKFMSAFVVISSLIYYEPIFRNYVQRMCQQVSDDKVQYLDIRAAFHADFRRKGCKNVDPDHMEQIRIMQEEVQKFKDSSKGQNFWGARLIWTTLRLFETEEIIQSMKECVRIKKRFPEFVAGYDLVGREDTGRSLVDLTPELFWFKKYCREEDVDIPFFFHAGETLGDGTSADENLFDAILLGTRRLGHGFSLYKHPLLLEMVKEKRILVESCPISNEVLRFTGSIMSHPLPALLAHGVPVAICNDDPAILGQGISGMSHDFWQALQGWKNLGLEGLGSLAENSVRWAAFEDCTAAEWTQDVKKGVVGSGIRAQRLREWMEEWESFCQWIISEYGTAEGSDSNSDSDQRRLQDIEAS